MTATEPATDRAAVIGAGAWGTTLAWLTAEKEHPVRLWARRTEQAQAIAATRENALHLPGTPLPDTIEVTDNLADALDAARYVLFVVPSAYLRGIVREAAPHIHPDARLISAIKGLELDTGKRMSQVILEETRRDPRQVMALSGPNLSGEIAARMPAMSAVAGTSEDLVRECQSFLSTPLFRIYANYDILGVEICGALKNVIAIAAGVSDGLGFGANAKAALVTRGLTEMGRFGTRLGADRATFWGIAGIGDLLATCNSPLSRNYQVGLRLGQGQPVSEAIRSQTSVAEGIPTTAAVCRLAHHLGVEAPIISALHGVLFEQDTPADAVKALMARQWRAEKEDWQ